MRAGAVLVVLVLAAAPVCGAPHGSPKADQSVRICADGDELKGKEQRRAFERGLKLAEEAAGQDPADAAAHFGIVCNLGKKMRLRGKSMLNLWSLRRLRREIDRTLQLAPNDADTLAAKAALLLNLPGLLGGDEKEAERLVLRALAVEPHNREALRLLAEVEKP